MRKLMTWVSAIAFAFSLSIAGAFASPSAVGGQGRSGAHARGNAAQGKKAEKPQATSKAQSNKPDEKGLQRAEEVANPQGVTHGLEKAETEQSTHEATPKGATQKGEKDKHQAKGKTKGRH